MIAVQPVLFKTDLLFFLLWVAAGLYALHARRHEHLRAPWREVARRPLGMAAAVVLAAYLAVALLDSLHFRPAPGAGAGRDVLSVFDLLVTPLRTQVERTYSAPFAAEAYAREVVELADGSSARDFPRLEHGGAHLRDPASERGPDIAARLIGGIVLGLGAAAALAAGVVGLEARRGRERFALAAARLARGDGDLPWRSMLAALAVLAVLIG